MTDTVIGMQTRDALAFFAALVDRLTGDTDTGHALDLGKLRALEGVREFPSRVKCATLAWHAMDAAIQKEEAPASSE